MEHKYEKSGLKQLNRMKLWRNVLVKSRLRPTFLLYCKSKELSEFFVELVSTDWACRPKFIVEYDGLDYCLAMPLLDVLYTSTKQTTDEDRERRWKNVDFCFVEDEVIKLEAMLSGVAVIDNVEDLLKALEKDWVFDNSTRVESFELGSKMLDKA